MWVWQQFIVNKIWCQLDQLSMCNSGDIWLSYILNSGDSVKKENFFFLRFWKQNPDEKIQKAVIEALNNIMLQLIYKKLPLNIYSINNNLKQKKKKTGLALSMCAIY